MQRFWDERDPTPGTSRNELYDRFLVRVAHAARFYGNGNRPGPVTDRGKTYIRFGPPHEFLDTDGVITGFGVYMQELHGEPGWTHVMWVTMADLAARSTSQLSFTMLTLAVAAGLAVGMLVGALTLLALAAPLLPLPNPHATDLAQRMLPAGSPGHLLGTDQLGRDLLSRISSTSVLVGLPSVFR